MALTETPKIPDFDLAVTGGGRLSARDLEGLRTVLYFYPKDDTPGCTLEGKEFSGLLDEFAAKGVRVYGVSADSVESHHAFQTGCDLTVPLVSDEGHHLAEALGAWGEKSMYGKTYVGVLRTTFLVGPQGEIQREWRDVKPQGHAAEVLASL